MSKKRKITLTKVKNKFYKIKNGKRKRINQKKVQDLIRYEKILRNLNIEENIDGISQVVTCGEFITIKKNNELIFSKNIFCGDWSKSSEIQKLLK